MLFHSWPLWLADSILYDQHPEHTSLWKGNFLDPYAKEIRQDNSACEHCLQHVTMDWLSENRCLSFWRKAIKNRRRETWRLVLIPCMQVDYIKSNPHTYVQKLLQVIQDKAVGIKHLADQAELCAGFLAKGQ